MITVNQATKDAYASDVSHKTLRVVFPELALTFTNESLDSESLRLSEAISNRDSIEFVGCIASSFKINIYNASVNLKGRKIEVYIKADNTQEIPLFKGIVDSAQMQANKKYKQIVAYDVLYTKGQTDVAAWYNGLNFPITLANLRNSLCAYIGLTQVSTTLPNDGLVIEKQFEPKTLQCLTVLKSICQLNGCFGIINRSALFEYRYIYNKFDEVFPATTLFPPFYPVANHRGEESEVANTFAFCKSISYEEYTVKPVERLQIRKSEDDIGVIVGNPTGNKYIIQNNMFAFNLDENTLRTIGRRTWDKVANISFHPCQTENYGMPFVEVGDVVDYVLSEGEAGSYNVNTFNVMSRELRGCQLLNDSYKATGSEEQSEFVTDIQSQLDAIKRNGVNMQDYYTKEETEEIFIPHEEAQIEFGEIADEKIAQMETPTGFNIVSAYTLPTNRQSNTLYIVGSTVVVL